MKTGYANPTKGARRGRAGASSPRRRLLLLLGALAILLAVAGVRTANSEGFREDRLRGMRLADLRATAARHPDDPLTQYYLGQALERAGRSSEAETAYGKALDGDPKASRSRARMAALFADRHEERAAEALLRQGLEADPTSLELHLALAQLYEGRGDFRRAAYHWELSTVLAPQKGELWYRLGRSWMALNDEGRALEPHLKAVKLDPLSPEYQKAAAMALRLRGRYDEAERHCRHALFLLPDDAAAHFERMKILRERDGTTEEVEASMRRAVSLRPDEPQFRFYMGAVYMDRGNLEPAAAEYRETLRLLPAHEPAPTLSAWSEWSLWLSYLKGSHLNLARVCQRRGEKEAASRHRRAYEETSQYHVRAGQLIGRIGNKPKDAPLRLELARLHAHSGRLALADEQYRVALGLRPDPSVETEWKRLRERAR
jgi:tetratricopeptide (TPR) repeat protein